MTSFAENKHSSTSGTWGQSGWFQSVSCDTSGSGQECRKSY